MLHTKLLIALFGVALIGIGCTNTNSNQPQNGLYSQTPAGSVPVEQVEPNTGAAAGVAEGNKIVTLTTTLGDVKIELFLDSAPITAGNFLKLASEDFYDGVTFHRVIPGFMVQGGDPLSKDEDPANDGTGGPGYFIADEFFEGSSNTIGTLSMANAGAGTGGSQFFINLGDNTFLDYDKEPQSSKHAVFGKVVEGMDIVEQISLAARDSRDRPLTNVVIEDIVVE